MKHFRGTFVFAILVIGVAGVALWQMQKGQKEESEKPNSDLIFSGVRTNDVTEFSFAGVAGQFKLKKQNAHWQVLEPVQDRADDADVEKTLGEILDTHAATIDTGEGPIDWAKFGLNEPDPLIQIKLVSGPLVQVRVGKVRTYDKGFYLRKNEENKLLNMTAAFEQLHNLTLNTLRSKKLVLPDGLPVKIAVTSNFTGKVFSYVLSSKGGEWSASQDKEMKIASRVVNQMVEELRNLKAEEIVSNTKSAEDLKKNRFQLPSAVFQIEFPNPEGADKPAIAAEIKFSAMDGHKVYFISTGNPAIYRIGRGHLETIARPIEALRDVKQPFLFETSKVARVKFVSPDFKEGLVLEKTEGKWQLATKDPNQKINEPVVDDFINNIQSLEAAEFLKSGAKTASHQYLAQLHDAKGDLILKIEFGGLYKEVKNNQEYYVVKSSKVDKLIAVRKAAIDRLVTPNIVQNPTKPAQVTEVKKVEQAPRSTLPASSPGRGSAPQHEGQ